MFSHHNVNQSFNLPENHISYEAESVVQKLIKPLQEKLSISYFNYSITYPDTSGFTLHNNARFYESWFTNEFPMCELSFEPGWYTWETCSTPTFLALSKQMDIGDGVILFERRNGMMITSAFASTVDNKQAPNTFLNNLTILKRFSGYFSEQCKNYIDRAHSQRITPLQDKIMQIQPEPRNYFIDNDLSSHELFHPFNLLSVREYECFRLLINSYSTMAISEKLGISTNTVNVYISRIKRKLQCYNKQQMLEKVKSTGLVEYFLN